MAAGRELEQQLMEIGSKILLPPSSVDEILSLLDHAELFLSRVEQSPAKSMQDALSPLTKALAAVELLRHSNVDVKVAVASCISEITRITAPDAPYDDDKMKDVFQLIVSSFENLPDKSSRSYNKRAMILETVAKVRSCVVMLDLECDGLISEMIQLFLSKIQEYHSESIFLSMETIMTLVLEESEEISPEILAPLLASVKKDNKDVLPIAVKLAEKVFQNCAVKLKPYLSQVIKSLDADIDDYSNIIASICRGDSSLNHNDENISNEPAAVEDNSVVTSTDEAQETQVAEDTENKEENATPVVNLTNGADGSDGSGNQKVVTSAMVESSVNVDKQIGDDQTSADKVTIKPEVDGLEAKKLPRLESKPVSAAKKKGKKSNTSTISESSNAAHFTDEKEVGGCPNQEKGHNVEALNGSVEEDKAVQTSSPMDDSVENLPSPKASVAEVVRTSSPSSIAGTLADEIRRKRTSRQKKQKLVKEDSGVKNATEGIKESEAKPKKLKRPSTDFVIEGKVIADGATSKSGGGGTSDSGLKARTESDTKAEECSHVNDATSSQRKKGFRNRGRDKVTSEDEKTKSDIKDEAKMIHTPNAPEKSTYDEGIHDETIATSTKRNRSSIIKSKKKASEITEYGENLVGAKVKVYWPKDFMFYEGAIESYDPVKKKHTINYVDGDIEVLYLKKQRWEFVDDLVSAEVEASEAVDQDDAYEMPKKKKSKAATPDTSAKLGKTNESSSKGASVTSSKSKAVGLTKSGVKSKDIKSKDEINESSKLKNKTPKPVTKSDDVISMKPKENDGPAWSKSKPKQPQESETPKTTTGGGSKSKGNKSTTTAGGGNNKVDTSCNNDSGKAKSKETGDTKEKKKVAKSTAVESSGAREESDAASASASVSVSASAAVSTKKRRR